MNINPNLQSVALTRTLNAYSVKMIDARNESEVYDLLYQSLREIVPDMYFILTKLQPDDMHFRAVSSYGFDKYLRVIKKVLHFNPFEKDYPFEKLNKNQLEDFERRKLHYFTDGLYEMLGGVLNRTVCKTIEKITGIMETHAMSLCANKKYFGGIDLFIPKKMDIKKFTEEVKLTVEIISNQASTAIQRIRDETDLIKLNHSLKSRTEQLIELNNTKDRFISIIAHDIKNPLNTISGFSDLLIKNFTLYPDEKKLSQIQFINDASKRLSNLLENLIQWAIVQREDQFNDIEPVQLSLLIDEGIGLYLPYVTHKNLQIVKDIDSSIFICIDKQSISTIIRNLFNNAIKYSNNGGLIRIKSIHSENEIGFSIIDSGTGMNVETIEKLLNTADMHSKPGTNNEKGSGIGFLLCKELIKKYNGKVAIESSPGKGTSIHVTFPNS